MSGWAGGGRTCAGFSLVELLLVVGITVAMCGLALPLAASTRDVQRARHAAMWLAGELRTARQRAVISRASAGLVFDLTSAGWAVRQCRDGNGNGLRRADIASGEDVCTGPAETLTTRIGGTAIALGADVPGLDAEPPGGEAVRFGSSTMASCSPTGGCSSGSVFVRSGRAQFAVRIAGVTGRARVFRYEAQARQWRQE